jgi:sodium transport system permease protein
MSARHIAIVFRKELTDAVRDRRTLINSILVPIILFPILMIGFIGLAVLFASRAARESPTLMILGEQHAPELAKQLRRAEVAGVLGRSREAAEPADGSGTRVEVVPAADDYAQRINDKKLRAAVEILPGLEENLRAQAAQTQALKVYWFEGEFRSRAVVRAVERVVRGYNERIVTERLSAAGLSAKLLTPFTHAKENVAPREKVTGNVLGMLLPYFIIILCLTGAMYPAMDLTAGEKERGTIETILASPVNRAHLVLGKFFLVVSFSAITALLSIVSFLITLLGGAQLFSRLTSSLVIAVSGKAAAAVFLLVLPLAVLFSAALMAIAIYARNYREAQTYIGPLMLVVILPAMASFIPGVQLDARFALVPILNVSLAAKEIFGGTYPWPLLGLILGSTTAYAGAALFFAVRQFHREDVLFRT